MAREPNGALVETLVADGNKAVDGFEAIAELDLNEDGRVDAAELAEGGVVVWRDGDADRVSATHELTMPSDERLLYIDLPVARVSAPRGPVCDDHGNCEIARSGFTFEDAEGALQRGAVIDINLAYLPRPGAEEPEDESDEWGEEDWESCYD